MNTARPQDYAEQRRIARRVLLSGDRYRPETRALAWAVLATANGKPCRQIRHAANTPRKAAP